MHTGIYYKLITPFKSKENNKYNYVYQITELSTGKKYIGSRGSTIDPNKDIRKYKSSSKDKQFKLNQNLNPLNYWYEILSYHETREYANIEESRLHELYNVGRNDIYLNKSKQTKNGFSTAGKITVVDKNGNTMQVSINDERYLNGDLIGVASGKVLVMDKNGNTMKVSIDDERYLNGELKHVTSGKVPVMDKNGNTMQVSKDDERYLNGELKHVTSGKVSVMDKNGNTMKVSINDERFLNGELIGVTAKWLTIEGEVMSPTIATKKYNIHRTTVFVRVKSINPKWSEWKFL